MSNSSPRLIKQWKCFDGYVKQYSHESLATKCSMVFTIFLPAAAETKKVPVLYFLSGLTCTDENFMTKAGAQRVASERGIAIIAPDTSPRGLNIEGEDDSYDFGTGAGFYVDATEPNWRENYNMYSYITKELPSIINSNFPIILGSQSIMGHSMGGHGALICALKNPGKYKSCSAFSPICHPVKCPWGIKAFTGYLGSDGEIWKDYDATHLMREKGPLPEINFLIDQGADDSFYIEKQLLPEAFESACAEKKQPCTLRLREGYDHSYYFISSFIDEHINHHADALLTST